MSALNGCVTVFSCLLLLLLLLCSTHYVTAWKPIAVSGGPPPAGVSSSFTTSFTLQQAHPAEKAAAANFAFATSAESSSSSAESKIEEDLQLRGVINSPHLALAGGGSGGGAPYHYGDDYFSNSYTSAAGGAQDNGYKVRDSCALKKFAFNADGVAKYESALPEFTQFTICFWMRFTNHSGDHVPLTYSVEKEPREIQFWIANSKNSSFISMAIKGQQMYRLNYPLRTRQWHHICSSWNGKTGEWQVWLKAERIGRGFHNSLVGYKIPANGKLYSGGTSVTGDIAHGLHFEVSLVQIYRIALSAGKAHRDHKHHHAHHFDHEGMELATTTKPPPVINRPQTMSNLLANGQIPTRVRLNLAQPNTQAVDGIAQAQFQQPQQLPPASQPGGGLTIHTNFVNGQINSGSRLVAQQLVGHTSTGQLPLRQPTTQTITQVHKFNKNPANVQYVDESETRIFFKRQAAAKNATTASTKTRRVTRQADKKRMQRGLVLLKDGSIVDDGLNDSEGPYKFDGLTDFAGQQFKDDLFKQYEERGNESGGASSDSGSSSNIDDQVAEHDREPAEDEVKAVMALCGACDTEPFQGAIVFAWKNVQADLDNALQGYTVGGCSNF